MFFQYVLAVPQAIVQNCPPMPELTPPTLSREPAAGAAGARVLARGDWLAAALADRAAARRLLRQMRESAGAGQESAAPAWDLSGVQRLDHIGAQLLWDHWGQRWPGQIELADAQRAMIERVAQYTTERPPRQRTTLGGALYALGGQVVHALDHLKHLVELIGQLHLDVLRLLRAPLRGPWRDISGHLYRMGAAALPITALVGFLIGVVLAYLMSLQLRQFGAEAFIVNILGISLIRELGPMLGAILVAGRSGSAITAQIGVMRVTEELDAMRVMGIPHGFRLVMPRALALGLAMPLIALWTTLAALGGGMLAADLTMDISPAYFAQSLPAAVQVSNLWLAMGKSVVFGVFIALIGCHWGLRVQPNTQSLGQGTTASVVSAITMVIIVDALFAVAFKNVGF